MGERELEGKRGRKEKEIESKCNGGKCRIKVVHENKKTAKIQTNKDEK